MPNMEEVLLEIIQVIRTEGSIDEKGVDRILARHNRIAKDSVRRYAKKHVAPFYLKVKSNEPERWKSWNIDSSLEAKLMGALRMKPRRTSSGVATITVITKPWKCSSNCLYCPNDVRMPKSYLSAEPACQRAERNWFDPYLQVASRLRALKNMGHITSKIELIILGGTFSDYPKEYQTWFIQQLFQALNDGDAMESKATIRRNTYRKAGIPNEADLLEFNAKNLQNQVIQGKMTYNEAIWQLYHENESWSQVSAWQRADMERLLAAHKDNESAQHRVVGLVVETRPDTITPENLTLIRQLGCTKVQMGIQSLDPSVLALNHRASRISDAKESIEYTARAINLVRLFGFKIHTHFMVNLYGSDPEQDKLEYHRFMTQPEYQPDEVKIYPCSLVAGTGLVDLYKKGDWKPYSEEQLLDVLCEDVLNTPEFCRISRMIRDISAGDILAGNKKGNLRQLVEQKIEKTGLPVREIRLREINDASADMESLRMVETPYETTSTKEVFLQWITPGNKIAGFLRLSMPDRDYIKNHPELSVSVNQAMIREVHVYGRVANIANAMGKTSSAEEQANAQHVGLGRKLIARACAIAKEQGYQQINVISSVGTREYYRQLGFSDGSLYQTKTL